MSLDACCEKIATMYTTVIKSIEGCAAAAGERAYGGVVRSMKGKLVEDITKEIILGAWRLLNQDVNRMTINSSKYKIPIKQDYVDSIKDADTREYILENVEDYFFSCSVDKQVYVDDDLVLGVECKSYTENAMLKRILVDFGLLKEKFPKISCYLFQLESQLGGDYSQLSETVYGSESSHTLMSYFPTVDLNIYTFVEGERKVKKPIHKPDYFKPINKNQIATAINAMKQELEQHQ